MASQLAPVPHNSDGVRKVFLMGFETTNERADDGYVHSVFHSGGGIVTPHRLVDCDAQSIIVELGLVEFRDLLIE